MRIVIRNLTRDNDKELILPMDINALEKELRNDEYIIIDYYGAVHPDEYSSITELNEFLLEYGDIKEELAILSATYYYEEVLEMVRKGSYRIIDFTAETMNWGCGKDIHNEDSLGRVMHEHGLRFDWERKYPIAEEMEDDIQWENLWTTAECTGWRTVRYKDNYYIVHRQEVNKMKVWSEVLVWLRKL